MSTATAISSTAKMIETVRSGSRCWTAVPTTTPAAAGTASSSPTSRSTLP